MKRWRSAAEIIDWTVPMYSIFATRKDIKERFGVNVVRPLADNTLRRVIRGVDKFTLRGGKPFLVECNHSGSGHMWDMEGPVRTVTQKCTQGVCAASLIQYHTEQSEHVRANGVTEPLPTVDASNRYGMVAANLVEYYGNGNPLDLSEPMRTVTSHDREALTAAHVVEFKGQDVGQNADRPLRTITASAGEFAMAGTVIRRFAPDTNVGHWPQVRELLNRFCGYELAEDEIILLEIDGKLWYIADISLRMLTPAELYRAMGFPPDYIIDRDYTGKPYPKSQQVARCGNAVCPQLAAAVVRANLPEWAVELNTMAEFEKEVAV